MKYMLEYTVRTAGLSFDQNFAGSQSLLTAFSKWKPDEEKGLTIHAFVANLADEEAMCWSKPTTQKPSPPSWQSITSGMTLM